MSKQLTIKFSGGYHNSNDKTVRAEVLGNLAYLSDRQIQGLWKNFCGIDGCACGGANRSDVTVPDGWQLIGRISNNGGGVVAERTKD